ncbi:hypothetical protein H5410_052834 [Solanum commersonii]|uniref:Uncharacterized protein n=1 Tax=Solanum commersonii TaxID=4109 RepID=A0A9J5X3B0_SOLCO|nr:hypothetical protein H5410_052834 [Solanum commersonii]
MCNKEQNKNIVEVYNEVISCHMSHDHPNLFDDFTFFLPDSSIFIAVLNIISINYPSSLIPYNNVLS